MKKIIVFAFFPCSLFAQKRNIKYADSSFYEIDKNIWRAVLIQPMFPDYESNLILAGNYEYSFNKRVSLSSKMGVATSIKHFGPIDNRNQYSFHFFGIAELKYYYSIKRRKKKFRPTINHSGCYFALEQNIISNPIALINQTEINALKGSSNFYFNIGYQRQYNRFYINGFLGVQLWNVGLSQYSPNTYGLNGGLHGGVSIGYVF
ncbi:MAG: hypothetical protein JST07_10285 [Bacteroidetes bacterium]|nr:hypothetical protein [Bacteroidota bacterium]